MAIASRSIGPWLLTLAKRDARGPRPRAQGGEGGGGGGDASGGAAGDGGGGGRAPAGALASVASVGFSLVSVGFVTATLAGPRGRSIRVTFSSSKYTEIWDSSALRVRPCLK